MMLNRTIAPAIKDAVEFDLKLKPYQKFILDNGVPVYAIDAGTQDVLQIELIVDAGNCYDQNAIIAGATNHLLRNGTTQKKSVDISEIVEFYGAYLNTTCQHEHASISLHLLAKHIEHLFPLIAELIQEANFPEEEIRTYATNRKQKLSVNLKKCDFVANRLIDEYVFGFQHPYGKYSVIEDFDGLNRDLLVNFYNQYYKNGSYKIFIAGKLPADIEQQLNKHFGHLPINQHQHKPVLPLPNGSSTLKHQVINDDKAVQGAIRIAKIFPNRHHPDFATAQILNNIFGGFFGSRLMSNIREDKGYTYGIHSYLQNHIQQSAWMISTEAGKEVCEATIVEVYKEMNRLCNEPVAAEELGLVQNYMMGSLLAELDGPFQLISRWKNYVLNNLEDDYFNQVIKTIKTITPDKLQQVAKTYLQPDSFYELVVY